MLGKQKEAELEDKGDGGEQQEPFKSLKLNETHGRDGGGAARKEGGGRGEKKGERRPTRPAVWKPATGGGKLLGCRSGFDAEVKLSINSDNNEPPPQGRDEQSGTCTSQRATASEMDNTDNSWEGWWGVST